jgi:hypothetical protein
LADLARTRMRTKIPGLEEAFAGLRLGTLTALSELPRLCSSKFLTRRYRSA